MSPNDPRPSADFHHLFEQLGIGRTQVKAAPLVRDSSRPLAWGLAASLIVGAAGRASWFMRGSSSAPQPISPAPLVVAGAYSDIQRPGRPQDDSLQNLRQANPLPLQPPKSAPVPTVIRIPIPQQMIPSQQAMPTGPRAPAMPNTTAPNPAASAPGQLPNLNNNTLSNPFNRFRLITQFLPARRPITGRQLSPNSNNHTNPVPGTKPTMLARGSGSAMPQLTAAQGFSARAAASFHAEISRNFAANSFDPRSSLSGAPRSDGTSTSSLGALPVVDSGPLLPLGTGAPNLTAVPPPSSGNDLPVRGPSSSSGPGFLSLLSLLTMSAGVAWLGTIGAKRKWSAPHIAMGMAPVLGGAMTLLLVDPGDPTGIDAQFTQLAAHHAAAQDCARPVSGDSEEPQSNCSGGSAVGLMGQAATSLLSMLNGLPNTGADNDGPPAIPEDRKPRPFGGPLLANAAGPVPTAAPQGAARPDGHGNSLGLNMLNDSMIVGQSRPGTQLYGMRQGTNPVAQTPAKLAAVINRTTGTASASRAGQHGASTNAAAPASKSGASATGSSGPIGFIGNPTRFVKQDASGSLYSHAAIDISTSASKDPYSGLLGPDESSKQASKGATNPASSSHGGSPSVIAATSSSIGNSPACGALGSEFNPSNGAAFIAQSGLFDTVLAGQTFNVNLTFLNTGQSTWTAGSDYKLGSADQGATWGSCRVWLDTGDSIAPGEQKTFSFPVTAPNNPGSYHFQWRMLQEGSSAFGDSSPDQVINVVRGGN